jgi:1,4-dihydroxy-6-naphthoate synthase
MKIKLGHSPDADDAFMFYGLSAGLVQTGKYEIEHVLADIQTLNDQASRGLLEITAISAHAYAYVRDKYALTRCGGSFGEGYGPKIVSREPMNEQDLERSCVAIPGTTTSAFLALQLYRPSLRTKVLPFDKIVPAVQAGLVDCGLIIHEGQVTYEQMGLYELVDLGKWWQSETHLPLPLGVNAIRRDLPRDVQEDLAKILLESIQYSLSHRKEALDYAMTYARNVPEDLADKFVGMYVNDLTLDMGPRGRSGIEQFLGQAHNAGLIPNALPLEIV